MENVDEEEGAGQSHRVGQGLRTWGRPRPLPEPQLLCRMERMRNRSSGLHEGDVNS